jgi:hypothetical protein
MDSENELCIVNPCKFRYAGGLQLKVKANKQIIEQLELSGELKDPENSKGVIQIICDTFSALSRPDLTNLTHVTDLNFAI